MPFYLSFEVENFLKKIILNPQTRENLKDIMPDPWLTVGQEEELKPYVVIDLWVTQEMLNLVFHWEDIKDMLSNKTYNNVVATYHILNTQKNKAQCHTIQVKPFHPPNLQSYSPSPA